MRKNKLLKITGFEAHILLWCLDTAFWTDEKGKVDPNRVRVAGSVEKAQELRDKLFAAHEHESD